MELETKKTPERQEKIRHWSDKEVKELHKQAGYNWRSNRTRLRVIAVTEKYRQEYEGIFGHK